MRSFWSYGDGGVRDLAFRLTGSSDLYGDDGRLPIASINFVTAHDGFTMRDLVSYEHKHNEDNGEDNRDGTDDNRSYNCGVEGDPAPAEVQHAAAAPGPQPAEHAAAVDRRADAGRRRRAVAHAARQQQRLRAGQRGLVAGLGTVATRPTTCSTLVAPAARRCAARTRCCGSRRSSRAARSTAATAARTSPGSTRPGAS